MAERVRAEADRFQAAGSAFPQISVADFAAAQCARFSERTAIEVIETGEMLSYAALWQLVSAAAGALAAHGVAPGDRVAIQMPNGWEYPVLWLALAQIGAVHVPINTRYTAEETAYVLTDSGARLMIAAASFVATAREAVRAAPQAPTLQEAEAFFAGLRDAPPPPNHRAAPDDLLNIQYTSGTTGMPKGCMLSHDYWLVLARSAALWDAVPARRLLSAQPYFYMDPQWITLKTLLNGATLVIGPGLSASRFLGWLLDHRIDWCMFPILMARQPRSGRERDTQLKQVATFGWDAETCARFHADYGALAREGFGMTEIGLGTAMPASLEDMRESASTASTGIAGPCRETSVRGPDGEILAPGREGELWVRGRSIFKGYWNRPEATAEACPGDGWFRTGDIFVKNAQGFHWITGRIKDMIRRSSENIAAREVEAALCTLPGLVEAAALAEPDDLRGEEVLAVLQHSDGVPSQDTAEGLIATLRSGLEPHLAVFKRPRYWAFVADYPRTPSNKVKKAELRAQIAGRPAYDSASESWTTLP
ncbi:class I adenylate-forming enzyme family protein [Algihabitans albus]|uniref:class I adenylate-forming enzyme family protein n=1 Tax=Algihabitans albus TaxID=2164067 RepID=UPI001ABCCF37|nr:class I adenylate-forming enzyme family protein [Algihabitans albus]